ncbi:MAG TPA: metallophosphoesterase family protein [Actinomycetota bacterium]|nr:metallophosphoesterase family protein [Actinomycetota bacterium]
MDRDRRRPHRTWLGAVPGPGGRRRPRLTLRRPTRASLTAFAKRIAPWALPLLAGALGAVLAVTLLARQEVTVGPARVRLEAGAGLTGSSRLAAPPFGSVSARTHQGPLTFRATIDDIDVQRLGRLLEGSPGPSGPGGPRFAELEATLGPLEDQARRAATVFLLRIAVLGLAGGLATVLLFRRRTRQRLVRCGLGGLTATVLLLGPALATYDLTAFREPRYDGALEYAPALIGDVRTGLDRLRTLREEMVRIGRNLDRAYAALASPVGEVDGNGTVRVLHISDLHLNPAGFDLAERLADQFDVAAVVDTGDMGTWGLPREPQVAANISRFEVPYLFVKGNHDDADMVEAVAANGNARVLDNGGTEVAGIRFYGAPDPTFTPGKGHQVEEFEELKVERSVGVADAVERQAQRPDVLLVHDGRLAAYARGHVATVLEGHLHRFGTEVVNGTRTLQTGTTGAGGPDNFRAEDPPPADAQVIYFDPGTRRPVAVDRITVSLPGSSFSVERLLLPEGATPFIPDPIEVPPELAPATGAQGG